MALSIEPKAVSMATRRPGWSHDLWHKLIPRREFNRRLSRVSGVRLHDQNCGFKCYRAEVAKELTLFGELHWMGPALAAMDGDTVAEIPVEHHVRKYGVSKHGFERCLRGFTGMLVMGFFRKFRDRPAHFVAGASAGSAALGLMLGVAGNATGLGGASAAGAALVAAGAAFVAAALIGVFSAIVAEIALLGGLTPAWALPLVDDTAGSGSPRTFQTPAARPGARGFVAPR